MYLDNNNNPRTDSLFVERIAQRHRDAGFKPVYSIAERGEKQGCKNLYDIFISSVDEYDFAIKAFGSKHHLDKLKNIKWFMESWRGCPSFRGYSAWLEDMDERDASIGKKVLIEKAREGDTSAAKKLIDMSKPAKTGAGRPRKEDVKRESVRLAEEQNDIQSDLDRLHSAKVIKLRS